MIELTQEQDAGIYAGFVAERWDRLQGEYGDIYRQATLHPLVGRLAEQVGADRIVDLGCGNGCTLRYLAGHGNRFLTGIEASVELVSIAESYESIDPRGIKYLVGDITDSQSEVWATVRGETDCRTLFIALFAAQDCEDLNAFFLSLMSCMSTCDSLLVIHETPLSYAPESRHRFAERGQIIEAVGLDDPIQEIRWLPIGDGNPSSIFAGTPEASFDTLAVTTRFRTRNDYLSCASRAGLRPVPDGAEELDAPSLSGSQAKFGALFFQRALLSSESA